MLAVVCRVYIQNFEYHLSKVPLFWPDPALFGAVGNTIISCILRSQLICICIVFWKTWFIWAQQDKGLRGIKHLYGKACIWTCLNTTNVQPSYDSLCKITWVRYIDYYMVFLIPAQISARVDRISLSPKGEGWYCPRAEIRAGIKNTV